MSGEVRAPSHGELIDDLRRLREHGLTSIRGLQLPKLSVAARLAGETLEEQPAPAVLERLLRTAIGRLGGGDLQRAAEYTFGIRSGMRDTPAAIRRRRAAEVYGVTPERFRKAQERMLVSQVADVILDLCTQGLLSRTIGEPPTSEPSELDSDSAERPERSLGRWVRPMQLAGRSEHPITLHVGPVQLLTDIDVIVSSENVYFEGSQTFKSSLSAALRLACATRDVAGEIIDDVIARELAEWIDKNGRRGLPVAPGTVAATSSGELHRRGIRRIYHAAIVSPKLGFEGYYVPPDAIPRAVRNVTLLARGEKDTFSPPLRSICFPLFGSGSGGLTQRHSLSWTWLSIEQVLAEGHGWDVHLLTRDVTSMELDGWIPVGR